MASLSQLAPLQFHHSTLPLQAKRVHAWCGGGVSLLLQNSREPGLLLRRISGLLPLVPPASCRKELDLVSFWVWLGKRRSSMKDVVGSPGTRGGLALRLSQFVCAAGSVAAMSSAYGSSNYTAFW
jgi:hypothetical protein